MPLLSKDESLQLEKRVYQNLTEAPLDPGSPFYQPIYQSSGVADPIDLMGKHIKFSAVESIQLFSGFRGSGKTTELKRLKARLDDEGYIVLYADALEYINPAEPIEISDLLVVLAAAYGEALTQFDTNIIQESYWARLRNWLTRTEVAIESSSIKAESQSPLKDVVGGIKASADFKLALKTTPSFRDNLRTFLTDRLGELKADINRFVADGVKAICNQYGKGKQIVFIFDNLEQLRGPLNSEQDVIRSVERVFTTHFQLLKLPNIHSVYTVPPWLKFVMPNFQQIVLIPNVRLWENDDARTPHAGGWTAMRGFVERRFTNDGCTEFFGQPDASGQYDAIEQLIAASGGTFRDLILLLRELVLRAKALPVPNDIVSAAITSVQRNFLPIAIDDARWLHDIGRLRMAALPSARPEDVSRLTRFLDTRFVLYLMNGKEWYDLHPMIRDEVRDIVKANTAEVPPPVEP